MDKVIIFNECCISNDKYLYIFGIFTKININKVDCFDCKNNIVEIEYIKCSTRPDFCIKILESILLDNLVTIIINDDIKFNNIKLNIPFKDKLNFLNKSTSNIISTICKDYNNRLDEWIKYNLKLGFDAIIIFDNSGNTRNKINESKGYIENMNIVTDKYKDNVLVIKCPYAPFENNHWNNIQRITLHIGATAFRNKVKFISFIDPDEFIYIPKNNNIREFLKNYDQTIQMSSNLLTNKKNNDNINNNILSICKYIGPDKYTKIFLNTSKCLNYNGGTNDVIFVVSPHERQNQIKLNKDVIIHYHCWVNNRCIYNDSMPYINDLYKFYIS